MAHESTKTRRPSSSKAAKERGEKVLPKPNRERIVEEPEVGPARVKRSSKTVQENPPKPIKTRTANKPDESAPRKSSRTTRDVPVNDPPKKMRAPKARASGKTPTSRVPPPAPTAPPFDGSGSGSEDEDEDELTSSEEETRRVPPTKKKPAAVRSPVARSSSEDESSLDEEESDSEEEEPDSDEEEDDDDDEGDFSGPEVEAESEYDFESRKVICLYEPATNTAKKEKPVKYTYATETDTDTDPVTSWMNGLQLVPTKKGSKKAGTARRARRRDDENILPRVPEVPSIRPLASQGRSKTLPAEGTHGKSRSRRPSMASSSGRPISPTQTRDYGDRISHAAHARRNSQAGFESPSSPEYRRGSVAYVATSPSPRTHSRHGPMSSGSGMGGGPPPPPSPNLHRSYTDGPQFYGAGYPPQPAYPAYAPYPSTPAPAAYNVPPPTAPYYGFSSFYPLTPSPNGYPQQQYQHPAYNGNGGPYMPNKSVGYDPTYGTGPTGPPPEYLNNMGYPAGMNGWNPYSTGNTTFAPPQPSRVFPTEDPNVKRMHDVIELQKVESALKTYLCIHDKSLCLDESFPPIALYYAVKYIAELAPAFTSPRALAKIEGQLYVFTQFSDLHHAVSVDLTLHDQVRKPAVEQMKAAAMDLVDDVFCQSHHLKNLLSILMTTLRSNRNTVRPSSNTELQAIHMRNGYALIRLVKSIVIILVWRFRVIKQDLKDGLAVDQLVELGTWMKVGYELSHLQVSYCFDQMFVPGMWPGAPTPNYPLYSVANSMISIEVYAGCILIQQLCVAAEVVGRASRLIYQPFKRNYTEDEQRLVRSIRAKAGLPKKFSS